MTRVPHRTSLSRGPEGKANGDRRALVRSEKCAGLRHGGGTRRCGIAAGVARAFQRCPGRACMALLLRPHEVRRVDNTGTQYDPNTWNRFIHYIPSCRTRGKWRIRLFGSSHQTLACCTCLSHRSRSTTALTNRRPQSHSERGEESPGRARDKHARLCTRLPAASAKSVAPAAGRGVRRRRCSSREHATQPFPTASDTARVAGAWVWCAAQTGMP
jgi:hypothetical protein